MAELSGYQEFGGFHWELGSLRNALAYQGLRMPHSGEAPTEELLLGVSGGIVAGYFIFEYQGVPPMFHFLTFNTFDPLPTAIERLGIETVKQGSASAAKARQNLLSALDRGRAPLVWADTFSLGHGVKPPAQDYHFSVPLLVIAYDEGRDEARFVDRAKVPFTVRASELDAARARPKKERQRLMLVDNLRPERLPEAVQAGIEQCLQNAYGEPPRQPMRGKFGLVAFERWLALLADEKAKNGWKRQFTEGSLRYEAISSFYHYTHHLGSGGYGARGRYADFLQEAALILGKDSLRQAAASFRQAEVAWGALYNTLLPESSPSLYQARTLIDEREHLLREQGGSSLAARREIDAQLIAIRDEGAQSLTFSVDEERSWREAMREAVLSLKESEEAAFAVLRAAID